MPFPKIDNAMLNTGNGIGQLLQLNAQGKLPNLDASQLINLPAGQNNNSAMVLLDTQVAIQGGIGQIDFTSFIDSSYKEYVVRGTDVSLSNPGDLGLRVRIGGVFKSTNGYTWGGQISGNAIGLVGAGTANTDYFPVIPTQPNLNGAKVDVGFALNISNPAGTLRTKALHVTGGGNGVNYNSGFGYYFGGAWNNAAGDHSPFDGLRFLPINGGLINTGIFKLYGIL